MNTDKIRQLLSNNPSTKRNFLGVFASDQIPQNLNKMRRGRKQTAYLVANLDQSWKEGSHWIAIKVNGGKKKPGVYFDSYGWPPINRAFTKILRGNYIFNKIQLQDTFSTCCGQWCMYFVWKSCEGKSLNKIIEKFIHSNKSRNDQLMNELVMKHFNFKEKVFDKEFLSDQISRAMKENASNPDIGQTATTGTLPNLATRKFAMMRKKPKRR